MLDLQPNGAFRPNTKLKYRAVGLNIYGGGFTIGALRHFNVVGQWEEINLARKTFDLNFTGIPRPLKFCDWPIDAHRGVDVVYANPPCAPWSNASNRKGRNMDVRFNDPRLVLTDHTMSTAMALEPTIFVLESVENAYNYGASFYESYKDAWLKRGYAVTYFLTDAVLHGAPCRRRRFHFYAHKVQLNFRKIRDDFKPPTVRDTIGDLVEHPLSQNDFMHYEISRGAWNGRAYRSLIRKCPPGKKLINHLPVDFDGIRPSIMCQRLQWDVVSPTVVGFNYLLHPQLNRWISFREGLRLMTYPDTFRARVDVPDATDTVLPLMGDVLCGIAKDAITKGLPAKIQHHIIDWRPLGKRY